MNDQEFFERAHANPFDDAPDFQAAVTDNPERQQLLEQLKNFDTSLKSGLESVSPSANLQQALLDIPEGSLHPDTDISAANDSFWRRNFQYAAVLLVAVGVIAIFQQGSTNPMESVVFNHIYSELDFLDDDTPLTLDEVNAIMDQRVGTAFSNSADIESLNINVAEDCWVDFENGVRGVHMVLAGNVGAVTVMVIPNTPVEEEITIADERFAGLISPTPGGNLVVVGEKEESLSMYSNMLAANINW